MDVHLLPEREVRIAVIPSYGETPSPSIIWRLVSSQTGGVACSLKELRLDVQLAAVFLFFCE